MPGTGRRPPPCIALSLACALSAGCGRPPAPPPARVTAATASTPRPSVEKPLVTHLEVEIIDRERTRLQCDGVPPRRIAVDVDGRRDGEVEIDCTTTLIMPPDVFTIDVDVPPGRHVLRIVDLTAGREANRAFDFPVLEPFGDGRGALVAEHLPVWISAGGIDIRAVRSGIGGRL